MKKYATILLLMSSQIFNFISAQELLHFEITNETASSINYLIDCDESYCFVALYEFASAYRVTSIAKMDIYGNEIDRLLDLSFDEYDIQFISHIYEKDDELIIFANANISEETEFITFSVSKTFDNPQLIDNIALGNLYLATVGFVYDEASNQFKTYGTTRNSGDNAFNGNFYLDVTVEGVLGSLQNIDFDNNVRLITSFAKITDNNTLLTLDGNNAIILDENFQSVANGILQYSLVDEFIDSFYITPFYSASYDDKLVMVGVGDNVSEFTSNISLVDFDNDTIVIDTVFSIIDASLFERVQSINVDRDDENNLVTVSVGEYGGGISITENTLYVDKFDEQLNRLWSVDINTSYELVSQHVHINDDATVYIAGYYREVDQLGIRKNFVIILSEEGEVVTSNIDIEVSDLVSIYPNPTNGDVTISGVDQLNQPYQLYDATGSMVKEGILDQLSLKNLSAGVYTVIFDGVSKRVVVF